MIRFLALIGLSFVLCACTPLRMVTYGSVYKLREDIIHRDISPSPHDWPIGNREGLADLPAALDDLPWLDSFLVVHKGELVFEHYARGFDQTSSFNIKSASKSLIALALGDAVASGDLPDLNTPITDFAPTRCQDITPGFDQVTLDHLLSMSGGLDDTENQDYDIWSSSDWVCAAYQTPLNTQAGSAFHYTTAQTFLVGAALEQLDQKPLYQVLEDRLLAPLGIQIHGWAEAPEGTGFGGSQLWLTPRDMALIGQIVLDHGQFNGEPLIEAAWIERLTTAQFETNWGNRQYGRGWWRGKIEGQSYHLAAGYGGQYIYIFEDLDLVIVTTADAPLFRPIGHRTPDLEAMLAWDVLSKLEHTN